MMRGSIPFFEHICLQKGKKKYINEFISTSESFNQFNRIPRFSKLISIEGNKYSLISGLESSERSIRKYFPVQIFIKKTLSSTAL
jgi:hypothetical protein